MKKVSWLLMLAFAVFAVLIASPMIAQDESDAAMIEQQNAELVQSFIEKNFIERNTAALDEAYKENAVWCAGAATTECTALTNAYRAQWSEQLFESFPDLEITIKNVVADGDTVFIEMLASGTFSKSILEPMTGTTIAPTNEVESWSWLMIDTLEAGMVVKERWYWMFYGWPVSPK